MSAPQQSTENGALGVLVADGALIHEEVAGERALCETLGHDYSGSGGVYLTEPGSPLAGLINCPACLAGRAGPPPSQRSAAHRFSNDLRYRTDDHEMQRQLTPGYVLEPVRDVLGGIALDPCTEPDNPTGAERFYTAAVDGAEQPWDAASIYCNPPYSKARERWVRRCILAAEAGSRVVLLMPSHTDTRLFHLAIDTASHVAFIKGRVKFGILRENRRQEAASHPSCLIGWNLTDAAPLAHLGAVWDLTADQATPPGGEA